MSIHTPLSPLQKSRAPFSLLFHENANSINTTNPLSEPLSAQPSHSDAKRSPIAWPASHKSRNPSGKRSSQNSVSIHPAAPNRSLKPTSSAFLRRFISFCLFLWGNQSPHAPRQRRLNSSTATAQSPLTTREANRRATRGTTRREWGHKQPPAQEALANDPN